ncbi:MAG: TerC family protein [Dehalococcoidales bacterium]|nr:TerC family protein [Dehalococcoidales bacterium]
MASTWLWLLFVAVIIVALTLDLFVFQRKAHVIPVKEALKLSAFWIALALVFNVVVYYALGAEKATEFLTAYLIEKSLSVDNLFVFLAIFTYFAAPRESHRKVLLWGILGALFFRGIFIFAGIELIERFRFLLYVLGVFLIYTSIKLLTQKEKEVHPEANPVVRLAKKFIRVSPIFDGAKFFTRSNGLRLATPLVIVLVTIETTDIMFATDSVPAVLAVTLDPFIVYTSNIFAILGLRALFFALAGLFYIFRFLAAGVCIVLFFVGVKMLLIDIFPISTFISLGVVGFLLLGSIALSLIFPKKESSDSAGKNE